MFRYKLIDALPFNMVYGDGDPEPVSDPNPDPEPSPAPTPEPKPHIKVKFEPHQQEAVNSLLADERRKLTKKNDELVALYETQKNLASTTAAEKLALEEKIADLKSEFLTKEQLTTSANEKKIAKLEADLKKTQAESKTWQERHRETTITNSLLGAATNHKAYRPDQVVTMLKDKTRLVEIVNENGQGTGNFETKVKIQTKDKEGQPLVLDLDPESAVKQLSEMEDYENLFISPATGGLGGANRGQSGSGGAVDRSKLSTEDYMALREQERKKSGARTR